MTIIQGYLAKEWIKWFVLSALFLFSLLLLQIIAEDMDSFAGWRSTLKNLSIWTISYAPWILPVACFAATLLTISFLTMRGELLGIQSCSFSWFHCFFPICLLGVSISLISWMVMIFEESILQYLDSEDSPKVESSFFRMKIGNDRLWYFENFDFQKKAGTKVHFYAYDRYGNDAFRIRARRAFWNNKEWVFEVGQFIGFYSDEGLPLLDAVSQNIVWEKNKKRSPKELGKSSPGFSKRFSILKFPRGWDDPTIHMLITRKPSELSFQRLKTVISEYPNKKEKSLDPFKYRFFQMNWNSFSCLISVLCGISIGIGNARQKMSRIATVSIAGMLLFYLFRTFSDSLGEHGVLPGFLAAGIPYFLIVAVCFSYSILFQRKLS